jgi:DNA-binding transcriptional regulator YiaG
MPDHDQAAHDQTDHGSPDRHQADPAEADHAEADHDHPDAATLSADDPQEHSRIRARRTELGLSRYELSHRTDISLSTIRRWEVNDPRGRNPHLRDVLRAAAALETTVDAIIEDWWQPEPPNRPSVFWEIREDRNS